MFFFFFQNSAITFRPKGALTFSLNFLKNLKLTYLCQTELLHLLCDLSLFAENCICNS